MDATAHAARPADGWEVWSRIRLALAGVVLCLPIAVMTIPWLQANLGSAALELPRWSWRVGELKRFPSRFEFEFNRALPFRVDVAAPARTVYVDWLRVSPAPEVVLGTGGWLYYIGATGDRIIDRHVRGRDPFTHEELERWRTFLLERTRRYRDLGAKYAFVIAPNKESIYPEHLPPWIGPRVGPTRLDQLMAHVKSEPEVTVIDLRATLRAAKPASVVYYKTDTHWNTRGAYVAYQEILRVLAPDFPGLGAKEWESLGPKAIERTGLDLARMLGLVPETPEADHVLDHGPCAPSDVVPAPIPADLESRLTVPSRVTRCNADGNVDAVIFHDSFGTALSPILARSFRSATSFGTTAGPNEKAGYGMPERLKANLVVEILAERSLGARPAI
jgi:hypothetical protein